MPVKTSPQSPSAAARRGGRGAVASIVIAAVCFSAALLAGLALAKTTATLHKSANSTIGKTIVVSSRGLTVYELSGETTHHLLCTKASGCFGFWPPLTVHSAKTKLSAPGIHGKLGVIHRNGLFQVTLSGHPLYLYAGDGGKKGNATGQGIMTFGGTWHVVATSSAGSGGMGGGSSSSTATSTYSYPSY
jgi:predicted lipoprotein with Yx(FWY)xxD motif